MCGARGHRNDKTRTTTKRRLKGPLKFRSFWPRTTWQWSPIPILTRSGTLWLFPLPQAEASDEGSKIRHHWRDSRGIAAGNWHNSKKGFPEMLPSMAETLEPLYSWKRGVLWRWWRDLISTISKLLFTSTVLELLGTSLYNSYLLSSSISKLIFLSAINLPLWCYNEIGTNPDMTTSFCA